MRFLALTLALATLPAMAAEYPPWDGEPIEEYAKKVGLPSTKTIDLGNGRSMELALVPAGRAVVGVPGPMSPVPGYVLGGVGVLGLTVLAVITLRRRRKTGRLQFGLRGLLGVSFLLGVLAWGISICVWEYTRRKEFGFAHCQEEVTIRRPFYMGRFEVTQGQYSRVTGEVLDKAPWHRGDDRPEPECLFSSAVAFCEMVQKRTGASVRLPTEIEWEYACRSGSVGPFYVDDTDSVAWTRENTNVYMPVGGKNPNPWGLYDMIGNAGEWCSDRFVRTCGTPCRVVKGGSIYISSANARKANRRFYPESDAGSPDPNLPLHGGFRVVCEITDQELSGDGH